MRTLDQSCASASPECGSNIGTRPKLPSASVLVFAGSAITAAPIGRVLEQAGYRVVVAHSYHAALQVLHYRLPDLVVIARSGPNVADVALCHAIKCSATTWHLPVIGVTTGIVGWPAAALAELDESLALPLEDAELVLCARILLRARRNVSRPERAEHVIFALARAVEAKDGYTEGHVQRLAGYVEAIGSRLGLGGDQLVVLRYGALLHDVGKIGVDERILRKPGALTPEEYRHIQQHVVIGEQIVQPLHVGIAIAPIVRHHHERWDGEGYPDRLARAAIPFGARVVAVADAFDAMTTQRPYNQPLSFEAAAERLIAGANVYWDPQVVAAFVGWLGSTRRAAQPETLLAREVGA